MDASLTGVVPVVPTIFRDDESVDLAGTALAAARDLLIMRWAR